jgi:hypothetical protein
MGCLMSSEGPKCYKSLSNPFYYESINKFSGQLSTYIDTTEGNDADIFVKFMQHVLSEYNNKFIEYFITFLVKQLLVEHTAVASPR